MFKEPPSWVHVVLLTFMFSVPSAMATAYFTSVYEGRQHDRDRKEKAEDKARDELVGELKDRLNRTAERHDRHVEELKRVEVLLGERGNVLQPDASHDGDLLEIAHNNDTEYMPVVGDQSWGPDFRLWKESPGLADVFSDLVRAESCYELAISYRVKCFMVRTAEEFIKCDSTRVLGVGAIAYDVASHSCQKAVDIVARGGYVESDPTKMMDFGTVPWKPNNPYHCTVHSISEGQRPDAGPAQ